VKWGAKIVGDLVDRSTWHNYGDYVDIIGFEVTSVGRMGLYNDGSFVRYIGNHVHDVAGPTSAGCDGGGAGIMHGNYSASDNDMIGNFVHDVGWTNSSQCKGFNTVHGLYQANTRGKILNNLVIHNRNYGIHLWHAPSYITIANNTSVNNGEGGLVVGDDGSVSGSDDYTVVTNNIFAHNATYGFEDDSGTVGPHNQYSYNITYANGAGNYTVSGGPVVGNMSFDPKFVNYTGDWTGDYHLQVGSPAIDAGTILNAPALDIEGGLRPIGVTFDPGCYEYGTTPAVWPWY
jgi:parallel beta-helix repeat protein